MRPNKILLLLASTALGISIACVADAADDGAKIFAESCSPCHSPKMRPLDNIHQSRDQWKDAVDRMIDQGAEVPKKKIPELLDYLVRTHGPAATTSDAGKK